MKIKNILKKFLQKIVENRANVHCSDYSQEEITKRIKNGVG